MLDVAEVSTIARNVLGQFNELTVEDVVTEPTTDSQGKDALHITLVLTPDSIDRLTGDDAVDLLLKLRGLLTAKGEDRLPIVGYATPQEMIALDDDE